MFGIVLILFTVVIVVFSWWGVRDLNKQSNDKKTKKIRKDE